MSVGSSGRETLPMLRGRDSICRWRRDERVEMALTECSECRKQVSEQAAACPHCGFPMAIRSQNAPLSRARQVPSNPQSSRLTKIVFVVVGVASVAFLINRKKDRQEPPSRSASGPQQGATTSPPVPAMPVRPRIPDDPPPPSAALAKDVPVLEAQLVGDPSYVSLWEPSRRTDLLLFLTAVSQFRATTDGQKTSIDEPLEKKLEARRIFQPAVTLMLISGRVGHYPADFDQNLRRVLAEMRFLPNLGLCGTSDSSKEVFDFSAIGAWTMKDRPEYLRGLLACRREKASKWPVVRAPHLPYIQTERGALERLALLDDLTQAERDRLEELNLPTADANDLWRAYDANEVAADNDWKGKRLVVSGEVAGISKDFTDAIFVQLRSPNAFSLTHAYVKDADAAKAATLKKRQRVSLTCTCTGKVVGSPVLRDCTIQS